MMEKVVMLIVDAPFGKSIVEVRSTEGSAILTEPSVIDPSLPDGLKVDKCVLGNIAIDTAMAKTFSVNWLITSADGWSADLDTGEHLDAYSFETPDGNEAAMGMRDSKWLCQHFDLRILHESFDGLGCQIEFEANGSTTVVLEFAAAWLEKPENEEAAIAPWIAIDRAMKF